MTCLQMILARQRGRAWTVVRQPRESQMGESNLDNQQYPPLLTRRHTEAAAWKDTQHVKRDLAATMICSGATG